MTKTKAAAAPGGRRGNGAVAPTAAPKGAEASVPKPAKTKLVRDSFTMPRDEYDAIEALKSRAARQGRITKKSEVLRAGLQLLSRCDDAALLQVLGALPHVKTGRPKTKHHG